MLQDILTPASRVLLQLLSLVVQPVPEDGRHVPALHDHLLFKVPAEALSVTNLLGRTIRECTSFGLQTAMAKFFPWPTLSAEVPTGFLFDGKTHLSIHQVP
jgi:hypothetical protein